MAITPKNPGAVDAPNTLTPDAAGSVAVPNSLTPESAGNVAVPNNLTPESAGSVAVPNSLTPESAGTVAVPNALTAESAGTVAVPNSLTAESAGSVAVPNSLTAETAGAVAVPNSLTAQSAVAFPRTLTPTVSMNFADGLYEQAGQSIAEGDLLTYSRASNATFIDKYVTPSGKEAFFLNTDFVGSVTNFARYSEQFNNSAWTKTNTTDQENRAIAPDGTRTADLILDNSVNSVHTIGQSVAATIGPDLTLSIYAKKEDHDTILLYELGLAIGVSFNLATGSAVATIGTPLNYSSRHVGDGWFLCTMTVPTPPGGIAEYRIYIIEGGSGYVGTGQGVYLWGAQVTETISVRPYVKTTLTSASQTFSESLRIGYDAATGENLGVLIEGGRTNICLYSEEIENSAWGKTVASANSNVTFAPDLTTSADKVEVSSTGTIQPSVYQTVATTAASSYTISAFVKRSESSFIQIHFLTGHVANNPRVNFDLSDGTIGTQDADIDAASITAVGGGWYRISATVVAVTTSLRFNFLLIKSATALRNDASSWTAGEGLYIWGVQIEQGATASSYIRTTTGAASRLADQLSIPVAGNVPSGDMTIHANIDKTGNANSSRYIYNVSSSSGSIYAYSNDASDRSILFSHGSTTLGIVGSDVLDSLSFSISLDRSTFTCTRYLNGVESSPESPVGVFAVPNQSGSLTIGQTTANSAHLYGHIKHLKIYDEALTAAEVAQL